MKDYEWHDVYKFWFPPDLDKAAFEKHRETASWWMQGGASQSLKPYADCVELALAGKLDHWSSTPKGRLSLIIVLDQFTRSLCPDSAKAYAGDAQALKLTEDGLENGHLDALEWPWERLFFLIPLAHAEGSDHLQRFSKLIDISNRLMHKVPAYLLPIYQFGHEQAVLQSGIIERFGRFPHRNQILSRLSTPSEEAYLETESPVHTRPMAE